MMDKLKVTGSSNMSAISNRLVEERISTFRRMMQSMGFSSHFHVSEAERENLDAGRIILLEKVFENDLILSIICKGFGLSDLKNFRRVSCKWKKVSEINFRKRGRVVIDSQKKNLPSTKEFEDFYGSQYGNEESLCNIPCTALTVQGLNPVKISVLTNFFGNGLGRFITDLKLDTPLFMDRKRSWDEHDAENSDFLDISEMIPKSVKKLYINPRISEESQEIHLSMRVLQNVDYIDLCRFKLKYCGEKISPKEIKLHNVKFISEDGEEEDIVLINKYLNFSNLKKLSLVDEIYELDMSEKDISLDLLCLHSTRKMLNWKDSNWAINKASFYVEHNIRKLNVKKLKTPSIIHLHHTSYICTIHLQYFPKTLETLSIFQLKGINVSGTGKLPNLKTMKLKCGDEGNVFVNVNLIPLSVNTLQLDNNISIFGDGVLELETLIFKHSSPHTVELLANKLENLRPKHLILSTDVLLAQNIHAKMDMIKFMKCHPNQRLTIGNLEWSHVQSCFLKPSDTLQNKDKSNEKPTTSSKMQNNCFQLPFIKYD